MTTLPNLLNETEVAALPNGSGSLVCVRGKLYRAAQVKHPRCARFSVQNEQGLFFVKVYRAALVRDIQTIEPGDPLRVIGELHSFVSRRCKNHHVFIKAVALLLSGGESTHDHA